MEIKWSRIISDNCPLTLKPINDDIIRIDMKLSRPLRYVAAFIALCSMLFTQLAVASYVCPAMPMESSNIALATTSTGTDHPSMIGCKGMDVTQSGLCHTHAHDQASKQTLDKPDYLEVAPFVPVGLVVAVAAVDDASRRLAAPPTSLFLTRTTAPPIAIRHCCFRI
jgi:hypothetical protein